MSELAAIFSSDRAIDQESVTFVIDANILIEFDAIARIDWELLCPARNVDSDCGADDGGPRDGQAQERFRSASSTGARVQQTATGD